MASKTTNYNLHKIGLTDAPPDITVLNQNFDIIDGELKKLKDADGNIPDVSGQIATHNADGSAHADLRAIANNAIPKSAFIPAGTDLNTITVSGIYRLEGAMVNAPLSADWGQLLVMHGGGDTITQIIGSYSNGKLWHRSGNPTNTGGVGKWCDWVEVYDSLNTPGKTYTATLTTSNWVAISDGRYYQNVTVSGVTANTKIVMVDVDLSTDDVDAKVAYLEAWALPSANEVDQGNGTLTFYAWEVPTVNIPINIGVM